MLIPIVLLLLAIQQSDAEIRRTQMEDVFFSVVGVFEQQAEIHRRAFNETIGFTADGTLRMKPFMLNPLRSDSYSLWRELCSNDNVHPIIVVGPQSPVTDGAVRDQCFESNIPYIKTTWQPYDPDTEDTIFDETDADEDLFLADITTEEPQEEVVSDDEQFKKITINFYPDINEIGLAYSKLLKYYNWEGFAVLYEDDFGLRRIQKILAEHTKEFPITVRKLNPIGDNKDIFKELAKFQESRILLDCHSSRINKYMEEANALNMINHYQHYILATMDASIVAENLTRYQSNITWLSITEYDKLKDPLHFLAQRVGHWVSEYPNLISIPVTALETEVLMMDDVANHVLKAVKSLEIRRNPPAVCSQEGPWEMGALFQKKILEIKTTGVSGNIEFNQTGHRVNYKLYVNEIHVSKRETIGIWESTNPTEIQENRKLDASNHQQSSKHFIIVSRKAKPFFYDKDPEANGEDEEDDGLEFEGYSVDLVKAIFHYLTNDLKYNYTYSFIKEEYKSIGTYNPVTKKWDGVFGVILDKKADLAVCDITITEARKKFVDFSVPILNLGISILFTKEQKIEPPMFSFLNPFSLEVWMYTLTAYCVVSIVMYVCSRFSPADWENPQPCDKDPEELENIWSFKNCAWLTMGSIMTQGCDILPKAVGTRWVCGMWWFFAMIVCQTYIAQLAASMTSALNNEPINSVEDLAKQNKILYGALSGGSTLEFFKNSKNKMYQRMYETMMANPVVLVDDIDEGEKRVIKGKNRYAFFMESSTIKYKLRRNCDLTEVGNKLDSKDYGIAMPANSPFRSQINGAILHLNDKTELEAIRKKWWEEKYGANDIKCEEEAEKGDTEGDLEIKNLIGAFIVLVIGLFISILISAAEFMDEVRNIVVNERITHKEAFLREIRFALNFFKTEKPVTIIESRESSEEPTAAEKEQQVDKRAALLSNFMDLEKLGQ